MSSTTVPEPDFLTVKEVAFRLRCSVKSVRRLIEEGKIKATRHLNKLLISRGDYWAYVDALRR